MMYNVAYFMLPPQDRRTIGHGRPGDARGNDAADRANDAADGGGQPSVPRLSRDTGHGIAQMLLRLLALAATVQLVSAITVVTVSMVAWAGRRPCGHAARMDRLVLQLDGRVARGRGSAGRGYHSRAALR